jgi:hypothetical protein
MRYYIKLNKETIEIPSTWDEVPANVIRVFAQAIILHGQDFFRKGKKGDLEIRSLTAFKQLRLLLLKELIGYKEYHPFFVRISHKIRRPIPSFFSINPEEIHRMINVFNVLDFLFTNIELTKNPVKKIDRFTGPEDNFKDLTFEEYRHANKYADLFARTQKKGHLYRMAAMLLRDPKQKVPHHQKDPEPIFTRLQELGEKIEPQLAEIYLFFIGCRLVRLERRYKHAFSGAGRGSLPFDLDTSDILLQGLANNDMRHIDEIQGKNVLEVFRWINTAVGKIEKTEKIV